MNVERLKQLVDLLIDKDEEFRVQAALNQVRAKLEELVQSPQAPNFQTQVANAVDNFRLAFSQLAGAFTPADKKLFSEIGAEKHFQNDLPENITTWLRENAMTPAVARDKIEHLKVSREQYLKNITQLRDRLNAVGIEAAKVEPGTAEIGFLIPRSLFSNRLDQLVRELGVINRIVRAFSEVVTGSTEVVEVRQISSSDPTFFFSISACTVLAIGKAVTWSLETWKKVEEIRRLRSETAKNKTWSEEQIKGFFDPKIQEIINTAIDEKLNEILPAPDKPGRENEQRNDLRWALESVLTRVERGMAIEIRFLPPPQKKIEGTEEVEAEPKEFAELKQIAPQLAFPKTESEPIRPLPPPEPPRL